MVIMPFFTRAKYATVYANTVLSIQAHNAFIQRGKITNVDRRLQSGFILNPRPQRGSGR